MVFIDSENGALYNKSEVIYLCFGVNARENSKKIQSNFRRALEGVGNNGPF